MVRGPTSNHVVGVHILVVRVSDENIVRQNCSGGFGRASEARMPEGRGPGMGRVTKRESVLGAGAKRRWVGEPKTALGRSEPQNRSAILDAEGAPEGWAGGASASIMALISQRTPVPKHVFDSCFGLIRPGKGQKCLPFEIENVVLAQLCTRIDIATRDDHCDLRAGSDVVWC